MDKNEEKTFKRTSGPNLIGIIFLTLGCLDHYLRIFSALNIDPMDFNNKPISKISTYCHYCPPPHFSIHVAKKRSTLTSFIIIYNTYVAKKQHCHGL